MFNKCINESFSTLMYWFNQENIFDEWYGFYVILFL